MAKTFIPEDSYNSNYKYRISDTNFLVITNNNCYTQYSTTYCDCYYIYPKNDYIRSETSSCNYNQSNYINYNQFTTNYWYRLDMSSILVMFFIIFIFGFYMPYRIISRLFGRWLKV